MFGDSYSKGAFSHPQFVLLGVFISAIVVTVGLSLLGLPGGLNGGVFVILFIGLMFLMWPVFKRVEPEFEHIERES